MVKECTLRTGKLPLGGLPRNSVVRITDHPDITSAVYHGLNQTYKKQQVVLALYNSRVNSADFFLCDR